MSHFSIFKHSNSTHSDKIYFPSLCLCVFVSLCWCMILVLRTRFVKSIVMPCDQACHMMQFGHCSYNLNICQLFSLLEIQ